MGQSNAVDSTANGNNGTGGGNTNTTGLIGDAQAFYGSNRVLTCTNHNDSLGVTSAVTMEAWIYYDSTSYGHWALFGKLNGTSANTADYALDMYGGSARIHTSNFQWYNTFYVPQRQWLYLAGTYDGNTREVWSNALYRAYDTQSPSSISNRWPSLLIGKSWDAGSWPGAIDEVRISGVVRSSNWLWACYANAASNTAFNAYESLTRTPDMKAPVLLLH